MKNQHKQAKTTEEAEPEDVSSPLASGGEREKEKPVGTKSTKLPQKCPLNKCFLCTREQPYCLARGPTWPAIMRVVFYVLQCDKPEKDFFNLKEDVYNVMLWHWDKLSIHKKSSLNWKKHIQDMLSHSKDLFESGLEIYGQNGYWRLKVNTDPWTLSGKTRRTPKKEMMAKRAREADQGLSAGLSSEPLPKRPFVPFIVRSGNVTNSTPNLSYVFINERSHPPPPQTTEPPFGMKNRPQFPLNSGNLFAAMPPPPPMMVLPSFATQPSPQMGSYFYTNEEKKSRNILNEEDGIVPQLCSKFAQFDKEMRMRISPAPVPSPDTVESTFKMFANAKPCNPCPVSFLLNES